MAIMLTSVIFTACATPPTANSPVTKSQPTQVKTSPTKVAENYVTQHNLVNRTEVVAVVESSDAAISLERKAARWGYGLKAKENLSGLGYYLLTFDCPPGIDPHVASREIEGMEAFTTVEVNHKYTLQSNPIEGLISRARIYADQMVNWPDDGCTTTVPIGMIDSAVDPTRTSLSHAKIVNRSFVSTHERLAETGHGTAIAELLVGQGRLKNTSLYSAAVIAEDESGEHYSGIGPLLKALDWQVKSGVKIINISLAGPYNKTLERAIDRAIDHGVIIVAAVGNTGPQSKPLYPAALENVIAATAIGQDLTIYSKAVQGTHVDFAAPGVDVYVGNEDSGRYITGTSIAAPFIVASIAVDPAVIDSSDLKVIKSRLSMSATDLGEKGYDPIYGNGLVNIDTFCQ